MGNKRENVSKLKRLNLIVRCLQICSGITYLQKNDIIHRDFALRNVLVSKKEDDKIILKISDLGMSTTTKYYSQDVEMIRKITLISKINF